MSSDEARERCKREFQDLARRGAFYGALVRAGLILKDLEDVGEWKEWLARIAALAPGRAIVDELEKQALQNLARAEHILMRRFKTTKSKSWRWDSLFDSTQSWRLMRRPASRSFLARRFV